MVNTSFVAAMPVSGASVHYLSHQICEMLFSVGASLDFS